jgi:hypothetical protein
MLHISRRHAAHNEIEHDFQTQYSSRFLMIEIEYAIPKDLKDLKATFQSYAKMSVVLCSPLKFSKGDRTHGFSSTPDSRTRS